MVETTQYVDPTNQMFAEYSQPNSYHQAQRAFIDLIIILIRFQIIGYT
jgi:hypothetical protein